MLKISDVIEKVRVHHPNADADLIRKAYVFAATSHEGQLRKSGEPYIIHPLAVSDIIADLRLDAQSVCAALLHDTVEDTQATLQDVETLFGKEVAEIVDGVTKLGKLRFRNQQEKQAENFRKMLLAMSRDIRVILVKLADRLHNMRTLGHVPEHKAQPIAAETMDIYAPLANRLGISGVKSELEDLSFRYLNPDAYASIRESVNQKRSEREAYIQEVIGLIKGALAEYNVVGEVSGRPKHFYSIYRKMKQNNLEFDQVYDAIAFRILVEDIPRCYAALGVVHNQWRPIPGRFKDYIALPKPNRYQSLHTSVLGPRNMRMEVQIRTTEMHDTAELGIASHWKYKEGNANVSLKDDEQKFAWLRQLLEWHQELDDPNDFLETVKVDLFGQEVYVFTPKGDLQVLPKGSTPIDFAFAVHSEVGNRCAGAKINGIMVPLDYVLRSGDTCDILTRHDQRPNPDWLKIAKTARAKTRIRTFVRLEQRTRGMAVGREVLEKALRKYKRSLQKEIKTGGLASVLPHFDASNVDDLLVLVGYGKVQADTVVKHLIPEDEREKLKDKPETVLERATKVVKNLMGQKSGIRVDGLDDVIVRYSRCCNPVPGDPIVGFVTRGRGVAIHTGDCRHVGDADPDRRIEVYWDVSSKHTHTISLSVMCANRPGLLAGISNALSECGINIASATCRTETDRAINQFEVTVENLDQLKNAMRSIERIRGVLAVERMRS